MKSPKKIILRMESESEMFGKYRYFLSHKGGCDNVTPDIEKATVFSEGDEITVSCRDWKAIRVKPKSK